MKYEDDVLDEIYGVEFNTSCKNCGEVEDIKLLRNLGISAKYKCNVCNDIYQVHFNNEH